MHLMSKTVRTLTHDVRVGLARDYGRRGYSMVAGTTLAGKYLQVSRFITDELVERNNDPEIMEYIEQELMQELSLSAFRAVA